MTRARSGTAVQIKTDKRDFPPSVMLPLDEPASSTAIFFNIPSRHSWQREPADPTGGLKPSSAVRDRNNARLFIGEMGEEEEIARERVELIPKPC